MIDMYKDEAETGFWSDSGPWFVVRVVLTIAFVFGLLWLGVMAARENQALRAQQGCDYYKSYTINSVPVECYKHFGLTQVAK